MNSTHIERLLGQEGLTRHSNEALPAVQRGGTLGSMPQVWEQPSPRQVHRQSSFLILPSFLYEISFYALSLSTKSPDASSKEICFPYHRDPHWQLPSPPFSLENVPFRDSLPITCSCDKNTLPMRMWKIIFNPPVSRCLYPKGHLVFNSRGILFRNSWGWYHGALGLMAPESPIHPNSCRDWNIIK